MFDKRLLSLVPGVRRLVAGKVVSLWVSLLMDIAFVFILIGLLGVMFAHVEPLALVACARQSSLSACLDTAHAKGLTSYIPTGTFQIDTMSIGEFTFVFVLMIACKYGATVMAAHFGNLAAQRVKLVLREQLYAKILRLGPSYAQRVRTADLVQSAGEGIEQLQSFFELFLPQLVFAVLAPVTLFFVLLPVNALSAVVLLVCAPLIIVITGMVSMSASRTFGKYWGRYTDMGSAFLDNLQGLETLKTFDADQRAADRMDEKAERFRVSTMRVLQIQLRSLCAMDAVAYGGAAAGIAVAIWQFAFGRIWLPDAMIIVLLSVSFFLPLRQLGSYFHVAMNGMTSSRRVFALLDSPEPERGTAIMPADADSISLSFEHVGYRYTAQSAATDSADAQAPASAAKPSPKSGAAAETLTVAGTAAAPETAPAPASGSGMPSAHTAAPTPTDALTDVSFLASSASLVAIVGASGSGKSTTAALVAGELTGYRGKIILQYQRLTGTGTVELADLTQESLTSLVTLVSTQSYLLEGTLRENLLMADRDATDNDMWIALKRARIDGFVYRQTKGLDMRIDQGAANLSGGQRQRLCVARALLHDTPIYVFDEATSSVDARSEELIVNTIRELAQTHTVLMITHRLVDAVHADRILVMEHGRLVESGEHESLISKNGIYASMFRAQQSEGMVAHHRKRMNNEHYLHSKQPHQSAVMASPSLATIVRKSEQAAAQAAAAETGTAAAQATSAVTGTSAATARPSAASVGAAAVADTRADAPRTHDTVAGTNTSADTSDSGSTSSGRSTSSNTSTSANTNVGSGVASSADTPSTGTFTLVRRLLSTVDNLTPFMVLACLFGVIGHLCAALMPVCAVFALFAQLDRPIWGVGVEPAVIALVVCALLRGVMRYAEQFMNHNVAFRLLALFRARVFAALRRLAPAKLVGKGKGDLIALVTTDVELLEIFFAHTISPVVIAVITTIVFALVAGFMNPWFALLIVVAHVLLGAVLPKLFAWYVRDIGPRLRKESSQLDDAMLDDMHGIGEIIRYGRGDERRARIAERTKSLHALQSKLSRRNSRFSGFAGILVMLATIAAAVLALAVGQPAPLDIGPVVAAFTLVASSFGPVLALSALPSNLTQTFAAARRLFSLMDESPAVVEQGSAKPQYHGMALHRVDFSYPDANYPVLRDYSLAVPQLGILGVQGHSGRGKSTILRLLMRYWDPQTGKVTFSGAEMPTVDARYRRRVQTLMSQETYLFDGTIRENLLMAVPDDGAVAGGAAASGNTAAAQVPDDELRKALRQASALELVDNLPQGLDTQVGELGGRLSAGERQRIGLARVFLRGARVALFDEPTSRVDALNEAVILRSISALADHGTAVVLVSHRHQTMQIADAVVQM